jgi:hypothetical protein
VSALRPGSHTLCPQRRLQENYWDQGGEDVYELSYRVLTANSNARAKAIPAGVTITVLGEVTLAQSFGGQMRLPKAR